MPAAAEANAGEGAPAKTGAERRVHKRLRPHELQNLQARLASGADIRLIDLSRGGAQFETDRRFLPNSSIALRLVTPDATFVVNGRVVRSRIVRLEQGGLGYNVAVSFLETLQHAIEGEEAQAAPPAPAAASRPVASAPPVSAAPAPARMDGPSPVELVSAADAAMASLDAAALAAGAIPIAERATDVTQEEQAAFEATVIDAPPMVTVTAEVDQSSDELRDLFNGNDW